MIFHRGSSDHALHDAASGRWYSYDELDESVRDLSRELQLPRKGLAFCLCRNDFASVTWYLAALEAGHAVALLDDGLAPEFKVRLISLYSPELILASTESARISAEAYEAAPAAGKNYCWRRLRESAGSIHPELALLLSTSGSTGSPKFVRLTKSNILSNADSICQALGIGLQERAVSSLPFHYSYGLSVLNTHLLAGASVVLTNEGLVSPSFWDAFRRNDCTSFAGVPYSYQMLSRLGIESLNIPSLQTLTQAGGKLHNDLIAKFHDIMVRRSGRLFVMYGQTEATARIAILPSRYIPEKLGSVGLAVPGGSLAINVDGELTTEPHMIGELVYNGPNVMMGYATSRKDLQRGDELNHCLYTGDSAFLDADGFLFITGRLKRDAKVFGLRLNLDEIENMLKVHGPTAVVSAGEKLLIFCEHGDPETYTRYRQELALKLNLHHQAFQFEHIERLPLNANGKVDYQSLAKKS